MGIMAMLMKAPAAGGGGSYVDDRDAGWSYLPAGYWGQGGTSGDTWYSHTYTWGVNAAAVLDTGQNMTAQITFTGTQVAVISGSTGSAGHVTVKIDGSLVGSFDIPTSPATGNQVLFTSATLSSGSHTLLLTCTSGQVYVDAILVTP